MELFIKLLGLVIVGFVVYLLWRCALKNSIALHDTQTRDIIWRYGINSPFMIHNIREMYDNTYIHTIGWFLS